MNVATCASTKRRDLLNERTEELVYSHTNKHEVQKSGTGSLCEQKV